MSDAKASFAEAGGLALAGNAVEAVPTLNFASYDDLHRMLTPSRLDLLKILARQGPLSLREAARRIGRDVDDDVTTLVNAGILDRTAKGIEFPYGKIRFEFDVSAAS